MKEVFGEEAEGIWTLACGRDFHRAQHLGGQWEIGSD